MIRAIVFSLLIPALYACMSVNSNNAAINVASRLVQAAWLDRVAFLGLTVPLRHSLQQRKGDTLSADDKKFTDCVFGLDILPITNMYAEEVVKALTQEEIQYATLFFEGEVGKKVARRTFVITAQQTGVEVLEKLDALSEQEVLELARFEKSGVGTKLLIEQLPNSESLTRRLISKYSEMIMACSQSKGVG